METKTEPANSFATTLADIGDGELLNEASVGLQECVAAATAQGKPAFLTIVIKVEPIKGGALAVRGEAKTKLPKAEPNVSLFYPTEQNTLSRDNPKQKDLPGIRTVAAPVEPARVVPIEEREVRRVAS